MAALRNGDLPSCSYDDYIQWEGEWELIDGIAYAVSPAPVKRQTLRILLVHSLSTSLRSSSISGNPIVR